MLPRSCRDVFPAACASPLGALRSAQLQALGLPPLATAYMVPALLPLEPCADAEEERLLLSAARFVAAQCGEDSARLSRVLERLPDLGFLLHTRLRAAEQRGQSLRGAFSFSGRTLESVMRLAEQHRRDALVDAAAAAVAAGTRPFMVLNEIPHGKHQPRWRAPLAWDAACDAMFAARTDSHVYRSGLPELRWRVTVPLPGTGALHGRWQMRELPTVAHVQREGEEQRNCLRQMCSHFSSHGHSLWSLRFAPDLGALLALQRGQHALAQVQRDARALRLTVHVQRNDVAEAKGPRNAEPHPLALAALAAWAHRAGVRVPQVGVFMGVVAEEIPAEDEERGAAACKPGGTDAA